MIEKISDSALTHVKVILDREREIESSIQAWALEKVKHQYAKESFLAYLNIEHGLEKDDIVHPVTGVITRVAVPAPQETVATVEEPHG